MIRAAVWPPLIYIVQIRTILSCRCLQWTLLHNKCSVFDCESNKLVLPDKNQSSHSLYLNLNVV